MAKNCCFALLIILKFSVAPGMAQIGDTINLNEFTAAELKEDYQVLVKTLQEAYPSLYRYNTRKHMELFFKKIWIA